MALVKCEEEDIRAIAKAIRLNPNFTNTYKLKDMPEATKDTFYNYQTMFKSLIDNRYDFIVQQLPENLSKIRNGAFVWCRNLILTELPESITEIGESAFEQCNNLALTKLPEGLTKIETYTFLNCHGLALTELPKNLTSINSYAFGNCYNITTLTFKGTPQSISSTAFYSCDNLTTINVPWSEGEVANAPWGATNATINYNCE